MHAARKHNLVALSSEHTARAYSARRYTSLHCYTLRRFAEGAEQFRRDVAVNPNDTEEAVWAFLCEARTLGFEQARARLLKVGRDSRPYMRTAYK
jgi:hypothetical protein